MTKPTPKRRFRFSLRTLLVVMAVVCILLGWKMNQVQRQRRAVEAIEVRGVVVKYYYQCLADGPAIADARHPGPPVIADKQILPTFLASNFKIAGTALR